jgi:DNA invertase Pin-like site-specific DNA recombinase
MNVISDDNPHDWEMPAFGLPPSDEDRSARAIRQILNGRRQGGGSAPQGAILISKEEVGFVPLAHRKGQGPLNVFGYARYSTNAQSYFDSFERQEFRINVEAEANGFDVKYIYRDPETSGAVGNRPGLNALIAQLKQTPGIVVVEGMDRWVRSPPLWAELKTMLIGTKSKLHFVDVGELNEIEELEQVREAAIERRRIRSRMYHGKCIHAPRGKNASRVPYGYYSDQNKYLRVNEEEAAVIRYIYVERAREIPTSYAQIAAVLVSRRIPTPGGGLLWTAHKVQHVIGREQYRGITRSVVPKPDWVD